MIQVPRPKATLRFNSFHFRAKPQISPAPLTNFQPYSTASSASQAASRTRSRLEKFNNRLPHFLQRYTKPLINAPVRHVTAFLILHEITAIVPLFGLVGLFHYGGWLPSLGGGDGDGDGNSVVNDGVRKFGKWLRKRGWVDIEAGDEAFDSTGTGVRGSNLDNTDSSGMGTISSEDGGGKQGMRLVVEFATAYAITKALLPIRIMGSVWATPWFAKSVLGPLLRTFRRAFGMPKKG